MADLRSLLMQGNIMNRRSGLGGERNVAQWQQNVGKVTGEDLGKLGINTMALGPAGSLSADAVDPAALKFDAMMALKKAQRQGFGVKQAQQRLDDAEMAGAGVDEVLRRRQKGFNEYTAKAQTGQLTPGGGEMGGPSPVITGQTGAALTSAARAGRPAMLPNATREFGDADVRRAMHFGGGMPSSRNQEAPFALTSADVNGDRLGAPVSDDGFRARRQTAIDSAVAGLGRARGPRRMQAFSGRPF